MSEESFDAVFAAADTDGKPEKWPRMPGHDPDLGTVRAYLTAAARLPAGWAIESAERHGQHAGDPMTISIRTPGEAPNVEVRFDAQRDCSKPGALRGALAEATDGASRMRYPTAPQASDFYVMTCALAHVATRTTVADETAAWLDDYTAEGTTILGLSLRDRTRAYDALAALQARPVFDAIRARTYIANNLHPDHRWALLIDADSEELWLRTGELATFVRVVLGQRIAQHTLDALVTEVGGERLIREEDRRRTGGRHVALRLYAFPSSQAFPHLYARTREAD